MWAAELAILAPQAVTTLVIMDSFLGVEPENSYYSYMSILRAVAEEQAFTTQLAAEIAALFFAASTQYQHQNIFPQFINRLTSLKGQAAVEVARVGQLIFSRRERLKALRTLNLPCLIAVGEDDRLRPLQESRLMHEQLVGSQLQIIPRAGHIANLEQVDLVNQVLLDFLGKNLASMSAGGGIQQGQINETEAV